MTKVSPKKSSSASDQSLYPRKLRKWLNPLAGLAAGVVYAAMEWTLDKFPDDAPDALIRIHDIFDWTAPVLLGVLVGYILNQHQREKQMNSILSTQNTHLKSRLLINTLFGHILHEIRNPIHNLSAALEGPGTVLAAEQKELVERNMKRLIDITVRLKRMMTRTGGVNPSEPVVFKTWLEKYIAQSAAREFKRSGIRFLDNTLPVPVAMHPLLLEQCFTVLFQNAILACQKTPEGSRFIGIKAGKAPEKPGFAAITLLNSGPEFSKTVIEDGGRKALESESGMGLGLVLTRDTLATVGGSLKISNEGGLPCVTVYIPSGPS